MGTLTVGNANLLAVLICIGATGADTLLILPGLAIDSILDARFWCPGTIAGIELRVI